ncbi:MAG: isoprenylcysteine carboxylmethyltransferase family protein [Planctomycetota bacterium]
MTEPTTPPNPEPEINALPEPSSAAPKPKDIEPPRVHPKRFIAHRRIVVSLVALSIPAFLIFGKPVEGTWKPIGLPMQIIGGIVLFIGLWIRFYATCWISGYKNRALLTDGPYRHVRHPLYLGNTLASLGVGLISLSPWVLGISALVMGPVFFGTALYEERKLTEWFGDAYTEFMKRTPRFCPRSWSFNFPDYAPMPFGIIREAFTALGYILIAALLTVINWMVASGAWSNCPYIKPIFHVFSGV